MYAGKSKSTHMLLFSLFFLLEFQACKLRYGSCVQTVKKLAVQICRHRGSLVSEVEDGLDGTNNLVRV
jgi:hypothetical protein